MAISGPSDPLAHPLLRGVDREVLDALRAGISIRSVLRGATLSSPGAPGGWIYLVLSGELRAYDVTSDGRELLLELIPAGGFDGLLVTSGRRGHFTSATTDSIVAFMNRHTLEQLIGLQPQVAFNVIDLVADRLDRRERQLNSLALRGPEEQLARQLLALAETVGEPAGARVALSRRVTHQLLADMLGLRRETVTLHLARLSGRGALVRRGRRLELDIAALRRLIEPAQPAARRRAVS